MKKGCLFLAIMLCICSMFGVGCNNEEYDYKSKITSIVLSRYASTIYKGGTSDLHCVTDAVFTDDKINFVVDNTDVVYVGKRANGTYYIYGKEIGTATLYAYNENNLTVKSNSITIKVTSDKDVYLTNNSLSLSSGVNLKKETLLKNNRRAQITYNIISSNISAADDTFSFLSTDFNVSNIIVDEINGNGVITEVYITLKKPVVTSGEYFEMCIADYGYYGTERKFYFKAGDRTAKITERFYGLFIMFYALEGGQNIEIENIAIDIKWTNSYGSLED